MEKNDFQTVAIVVLDNLGSGDPYTDTNVLQSFAFAGATYKLATNAKPGLRTACSFAPITTYVR
jgi:hypothetical protein